MFNIFLWCGLPQSYIVKPFATIPKDLPQPCWHWLTGGTFDSATGGTFQSDTDGIFHSDIPGTFESDMGGTFKVLQSVSHSKAIMPHRRDSAILVMLRILADVTDSLWCYWTVNNCSISHQ